MESGLKYVVALENIILIFSLYLIPQHGRFNCQQLEFGVEKDEQIQVNYLLEEEQDWRKKKKMLFLWGRRGCAWLCFS